MSQIPGITVMQRELSVGRVLIKISEVYPDFQSNSLNNRFINLLLGLNLPITYSALWGEGHNLARNTVIISLSELQKS